MYFDKTPAAFLSFARRLLLVASCASVSAHAADLAGESDLPAPSTAAAQWDGLYFGMHGGYGVGSTQWRDPNGRYSAVGDVSADGYNDGLLGGVQVGYNKQYGALVIGVEGDVNSGRLVGYATCGATYGVGGSGDACRNQTELMASLTGRLGYAAGPALFYVKGGAAYSRDRTSVTNDYYLPIPAASSSASRYGWTVGAGIAYAINPHWSVNAEYGYYDFGKQTYASGSGENAGSFSVAHVQQVAKFGLNYRLGGAAGESGNGQAWLASNGLSGEFGTRVGYSSGRFQKKLYDPFERSHLNSILTWPGQRSKFSPALITARAGFSRERSAA